MWHHILTETSYTKTYSVIYVFQANGEINQANCERYIMNVRPIEASRRKFRSTQLLMLLTLPLAKWNRQWSATSLRTV